jgi:hypothetical protein
LQENFDSKREESKGNSLVYTTQPDKKKARAEKDEQLNMFGVVSPSSDFSRTDSIDEDDIRNLARTAQGRATLNMPMTTGRAFGHSTSRANMMQA